MSDAPSIAVTGGGHAPSPVVEGIARHWALLFLVLLWVVFSFTGRGFFELANFQHVVHLQTLPLLLAAAETLVIITGGIDLSLGFVAGLASVLAATFMQGLAARGLPVEVVIAGGAVGGLAASLLPGLVNGLVITRFGVPPFIATLGMWGIANGVALKLCQGFPVANLPAQLPRIGNGYLLYVLPGHWVSLFDKPAGFPDNRVRELWRVVPWSLPFVLVVLGALAFTLRRGRFGRHTYAIGGSMDAATRAGIDVKRHLLAVYVIAAGLAGLAGVFNVFQTGIGNYTTFSSMYELFAVAAVVIGGASLSGGKGTILGGAVGVLVIAFLENGLALSGVQPFYRYIAVGVLLVIAVVIDKLFPDLR